MEIAPVHLAPGRKPGKVGRSTMASPEKQDELPERKRRAPGRKRGAPARKRKALGRKRTVPQNNCRGAGRKLGTGWNENHGLVKGSIGDCICGKSFKTWHTLGEHLRYYSPKQWFQCQLCPRRYPGWPYYHRHLRMMHKMNSEEIEEERKKTAGIDGKGKEVGNHVNEIKEESVDEVEVEVEVETTGWEMNVETIKEEEVLEEFAGTGTIMEMEGIKMENEEEEQVKEEESWDISSNELLENCWTFADEEDGMGMAPVLVLVKKEN